MGSNSLTKTKNSRSTKVTIVTTEGTVGCPSTRGVGRNRREERPTQSDGSDEVPELGKGRETPRGHFLGRITTVIPEVENHPEVHVGGDLLRLRASGDVSPRPSSVGAQSPTQGSP